MKNLNVKNHRIKGESNQHQKNQNYRQANNAIKPAYGYFEQRMMQQTHKIRRQHPTRQLLASRRAPLMLIYLKPPYLNPARITSCEKKPGNAWPMYWLNTLMMMNLPLIMMTTPWPQDASWATDSGVTWSSSARENSLPPEIGHWSNHCTSNYIPYSLFHTFNMAVNTPNHPQKSNSWKSSNNMLYRMTTNTNNMINVSIKIFR